MNKSSQSTANAVALFAAAVAGAVCTPACGAMPSADGAIETDGEAWKCRPKNCQPDAGADSGTSADAGTDSGVLSDAAPSAGLVPPDTSGPHYYVSIDGSDSNPGTTAAPFRTITYAYTNHAAPGVTITVMPGAYTDFQSGWGVHLGASGTATQPIVLRAQIPGTAVIDGGQRSAQPVVVYVDGSYNTVWGFRIRNGYHGGIGIWAGSTPVRGTQVLQNEIDHNGQGCGSTGSPCGQGIFTSGENSDNVYAGNYIHDNGVSQNNLDHGLYLCDDNARVFNNIVVRNGNWGLQIAGYTTVSNMNVYNNVFAENGTGGIMLWQALDGVTIENNVLYKNGTSGIDSWDAHGSGVVIDHNLPYGNGGGDYNFTHGSSDYAYTLGATIHGDPLFVNDASDFHLQAGSPGIDSGRTLGEVPFDFDGVPRPRGAAYDIGAFER